MAKKPKIDKSRAQHSWDLEVLEGLHPAGCLNRHVSAYQANDPCSHRWQAFEKALASRRYNWPSDAKGPRKPGAWDIGRDKDNFKLSSRKPYGHEAHHIVPNSELRNAIGDVATEDPDAWIIVLLIRMGLLMEEYNLNDKLNMVILPINRRHGAVLNLPCHRETGKWHHSKYSAHVGRDLKKIFAPMKQKKKNHDDPPSYEEAREKIETLSKDLYPQIIRSDAKYLDDVKLKKTKGGSPP